MDNQSKNIVNTVCATCLLFNMTIFIPVKIFQNLGIESILLITVIWMIIINLFPILHILKIDILKLEFTKSKTNLSRVNIVLLMIYFWLLYRLICYAAIQIPLLSSFLISADIKFTFITVIAYTILGPIVEEIIYRGILLEQLRKNGNEYAIIVSAVIFAIGHFQSSIIVIFTGVFLGIIYVVTNNLKISIMLHMLINISSLAESTSGLTTHQLLLFYGILFILCFIITRILKTNKASTNNYYTNKFSITTIKNDKKKYCEVFSTGGFIAYFLFSFINCL